MPAAFVRHRLPQGKAIEFGHTAGFSVGLDNALHQFGAVNAFDGEVSPSASLRSRSRPNSIVCHLCEPGM